MIYDVDPSKLHTSHDVRSCYRPKCAWIRPQPTSYCRRNRKSCELNLPVKGTLFSVAPNSKLSRGCRFRILALISEIWRKSLDR
jgi:hypothetical protein